MFETRDGASFLAVDELDLVRKLREASHTPSPNEVKFMHDTADRAQMQVGKFVRSDTPENFVADLIAAGLIRELTIN